MADYLWLELDDDEGGILTYRIAEGQPYRGYEAKFAAEQLLTKCWEKERDETDDWSFDGGLAVFQPGLLSGEDVHRIPKTVLGGLKPRPLSRIENS